MRKQNRTLSQILQAKRLTELIQQTLASSTLAVDLNNQIRILLNTHIPFDLPNPTKHVDTFALSHIKIIETT